MQIEVVFTGRNYHTAESLPPRLELPDEAGLAVAIEEVNAALSEPLPPSCMISVSGRHLGTVGRFEDAPLRDGDQLLLVAPVAGG